MPNIGSFCKLLEGTEFHEKLLILVMFYLLPQIFFILEVIKWRLFLQSFQ